MFAFPLASLFALCPESRVTGYIQECSCVFVHVHCVLLSTGTLLSLFGARELALQGRCWACGDGTGSAAAAAAVAIAGPQRRHSGGGGELKDEHRGRERRGRERHHHAPPRPGQGLLEDARLEVAAGPGGHEVHGVDGAQDGPLGLDGPLGSNRTTLTSGSRTVVLCDLNHRLRTLTILSRSVGTSGVSATVDMSYERPTDFEQVGQSAWDFTGRHSKMDEVRMREQSAELLVVTTIIHPFA